MGKQVLLETYLEIADDQCYYLEKPHSGGSNEMVFVGYPDKGERKVAAA